MSKVYSNKNSGLVTIMGGVIKSISDDRMTLVVTVKEWDRIAGAEKENEYTIAAGAPVENLAPGMTITTGGYKNRGVIGAEFIMNGNDIHEEQDLTVLSGWVKFARFNEEKNADGTPRMKQDGVTPKKPHFDVTISVKEGDRYVDHVVKIYNTGGERDLIESAKKAFGRFDKDNNRIVATFVTSPGQAYTRPYTDKNGNEQIAHCASHLGYRSMNLEYIDAKERTQAAPAKAPEAAKNEAPAPTPAPAPAKSSGFDGAVSDYESEEVDFN